MTSSRPRDLSWQGCFVLEVMADVLNQNVFLILRIVYLRKPTRVTRCRFQVVASTLSLPRRRVNPKGSGGGGGGGAVL